MLISDNIGERTDFHAVTQNVTESKKIKHPLQESQSNVQAIFENTSDVFILIDINGIIKSFNNKARDRILLNIHHEIAAGKSIFDFLPESIGKMYKDNISKVLSGKTLQYDYPYTRQNGQTKWFSYTINPVYNAEKIEGIAINSADITERKKAEQQLKESELFNKGILDSLSSHIAVIDCKGNIIEVNKAWDDFAKANGARILQGLSTGSNYFEVCERSLASGDLVAGQTLQGIRSVFSKEIKSFELEYPCHSLTEQRWFNLSVTSFGKDDSNAVVSHQNITQRKIAEQKSEKNESRLKEAQAVANVGSWETDLQTLNVTWSEETHHIFHTDPNKFEVTHEAFLSFIHGADRNKVNTAFENSINSLEINSIEHSIIATDGRVKHVIENWRIFNDGDGRPVRAVGTCQDITQRKIAEDKLYATSKELEKAVDSLNKILDSSLDVICTINGNGEFVDVSAASQKVWGYKPEELIGSNFRNLVYKEDADIASEVAERIFSGTQVPIFENRYVHKSGRVVPILWSANWDEKLQLMFCLAKDVTEKKGLEKAVENQRDQFFHMFLNAPSAIGVLKGADHIFEMANPLYLQSYR